MKGNTATETQPQSEKVVPISKKSAAQARLDFPKKLPELKRRILAGDGTAQIARELGVSEVSVKRWRRRLAAEKKSGAVKFAELPRPAEKAPKALPAIAKAWGNFLVSLREIQREGVDEATAVKALKDSFSQQ